jgi:hypothetical protein
MLSKLPTFFFKNKAPVDNQMSEGQVKERLTANDEEINSPSNSERPMHRNIPKL